MVVDFKDHKVILLYNSVSGIEVAVYPEHLEKLKQEVSEEPVDTQAVKAALSHCKSRVSHGPDSYQLIPIHDDFTYEKFISRDHLVVDHHYTGPSEPLDETKLKYLSIYWNEAHPCPPPHLTFASDGELYVPYYQLVYDSQGIAIVTYSLGAYKTVYIKLDHLVVKE